MRLQDYLDISELKYCAPGGHEILSSLQGGLAGPAVLKRKGIRDKIDFIELKGLFMQFALDRNLEQELGFTRSPAFSSEIEDCCWNLESTGEAWRLLARHFQDCIILLSTPR